MTGAEAIIPRASHAPTPRLVRFPRRPYVSLTMPQTAETVLAADAVRVEFDRFTAVDDVSLALRGGHLLGLIGPNGAGKTTLLRALAGIQPLRRGVVRVFDEPLTPSAQHLLRHIGFTPDTPSVYEDLSVRDFLRFIAKGYELSSREAEERIDFWLEKVWLSEKRDVKIKQLSRGMRQRIGIARTLLPNPSLVLLDEPSAGLDPAGRVQFRQLLVSLREQGKALIVSSHILLDMAEYCTHIGIMSRGALVRFGTVAEVASSASDGTNGDATRCRYTIALAHPVAGLAGLLAEIAGVTHIDADGDRVVLEYGATRDDAAVLLARLVERKVPVAAFSPNAPGLEEAYLRTEIAQVD